MHAVNHFSFFFAVLAVVHRTSEAAGVTVYNTTWRLPRMHAVLLA